MTRIVDRLQAATRDGGTQAATRKIYVYDGLAIGLCLLSFGFSWIESSVNTDSHHWGFMYVPALDYERGLVPHRDFLMFYGYLTTWIQFLSLKLLGDSIKSIGIVTGLCYSLSILLSYILLTKF